MGLEQLWNRCSGRTREWNQKQIECIFTFCWNPVYLFLCLQVSATGCGSEPSRLLVMMRMFGVAPCEGQTSCINNTSKDYCYSARIRSTVLQGLPFGGVPTVLALDFMCFLVSLLGSWPWDPENTVRFIRLQSHVCSWFDFLTIFLWKKICWLRKVAFLFLFFIHFNIPFVQFRFIFLITGNNYFHSAAFI